MEVFVSGGIAALGRRVRQREIRPTDLPDPAPAKGDPADESPNQCPAVRAGRVSPYRRIAHAVNSTIVQLAS
jgi:hypothetical protein